MCLTVGTSQNSLKTIFLYLNYFGAVFSIKSLDKRIKASYLSLLTFCSVYPVMFMHFIIRMYLYMSVIFLL